LRFAYSLQVSPGEFKTLENVGHPLGTIFPALTYQAYFSKAASPHFGITYKRFERMANYTRLGKISKKNPEYL
jgi:hypothetical protein